MKGFCLFSGSKVTNNEEFRKQLQAKNKCLLGLILLGIISAAAAYYMEFSGKMKVDDYMLGVYCGIGVGFICLGIAFLIRNKCLMKDEEKLKEARLQVKDTKVRRLVPEHPDPVLKVDRCLCTDVFPREALPTEIQRKSLLLI